MQIVIRKASSFIAMSMLIIIFFIISFFITSTTLVYSEKVRLPDLQHYSIITPLQKPKAISPKLHPVKITSLTNNQHVSIGKDLTISGTFLPNNATGSTDGCKVSIRVNKISPYQSAPTRIAGPGTLDYSKWNFVLTSKYTTIKPGQNRITAKYECGNDPSLTAFSSVNVTGVPVAAASSSMKTSTLASSSRSPSMQTTNSAAQVSNDTNKATLSVIGPQLSAVNQQRHQPPTMANTTAISKFNFTSTSQVPLPSKMTYLGNHGSKTSSDNYAKSTAHDLSTKDSRNHHTHSSEKTKAATKHDSKASHLSKQKNSSDDKSKKATGSKFRFDPFDFPIYH